MCVNVYKLMKSKMILKEQIRQSVLNLVPRLRPLQCNLK